MDAAGPLPGLLRIADAARQVGVSASALRLWERQGLVTPSRPGGRERRYGPAEMEQLRRIRRLRAVEGLNAAAIRRELGPDLERRPAHAGEGSARPDSRTGSADSRTGPADARAVGERLRALRGDAGLSLRGVAARAGLSPSFVSGLERGTTGASIAALVRLAGVFDTTVGTLVGGTGGRSDGPGERSRVVRRDGRSVIDAGRGVRIEELATEPTRLEPQLFVLAPGATSDGAYAHAGEEFMYVLAGRVAVWLDERECHELGAGDALTFPSSIPHRFVALGGGETQILWVNTPPTF